MLISKVLERIFFNLPVESLRQCFRVCKAWRSIILRRNFIYTHMEKGPNSHKKLFFFLPYDRDSWDPYSLRSEYLRSEDFKILIPTWNDIRHQPSLLFDDQDFREFMRLDPRFCPHDKFEIVGSCNGLVCLAGGNRVLLWNPALGQSLLIALTIPNPFDMDSRNFVAFGFDSANQDYKILRMENIFHDMSQNVRTELYSLNDRSWKDISYCAPNYRLKEYGIRFGSTMKPSVCVNGALHWAVMSVQMNVVAAFDLANGVFREILLPDCLAKLQPSTYPNKKLKASELSLAIIPFGSSLAVSHGVTESFDEYDIWVMKRYDEHSSWYKFGTFGQRHAICSDQRMMKVLLLRNNGHAVIQYFRGWLGSQDPELNMFQRFNISGNVWANMCSYVESLVPLNKRDCVEVARSVAGDGRNISTET